MAFELTPAQRETLGQALYAGNKISAIQQLRQLSGLDLKGSKEIIDRLETELRAAHPERFTVTPQPKLTGCIVAAFLVLLTGAVLFYLFRR